MFNNITDLISWIESQKRMVPKISLDRMRRICELFGNPQAGLKYIHVGGTNGKGSTVSFIKTVLLEAGYNIGTFISPYVDVFNERIAFNNQYISDDELLELGNYIIGKYYLFDDNDISRPSFFEFITLMAFIYFSRQSQIDLVILEVGLGGLLDATNIIIPLVTVITSISYDHEKVLGTSLQEIARNKLGIVKSGVPLVTLKNEDVFDIVRTAVTEKQSPLVLIDPKDIKNIKATLDYTSFDYQDYHNLEVGLLGFHQAENAVLALRTIRVLSDIYGYRINTAALRRGLRLTKWPGRLQLISQNPVILLDGAHNPGGIVRLVEFLQSIKGGKYLRVVFAVSADKDKPEMIQTLDEVADEIIFTRFGYKRSDTAENLIQLSHHYNKRLENDWQTLLTMAFADKTSISVFCGSLYFVSEIYNYLKKMHP
ncbi:MAG: bifunctional folylpolyglutamate synthase/dihydrofolate synthase [Bacilli bacterium]|nr:bifunctional folylpolyglutamate synthase/dihydrofolate synthase [Bacilli bacterium]MDD4388590.1 bifunctional folylpolyglutamate synthase/dihydrofolate synthase [Bacilli bacterium]